MGNHPILPNHRPLAIAHRHGNTIALAQRAIDSGFDMIETDVWPFRGQIEVRHAKSLGPLPIYRENWRIESVGRWKLKLGDLIKALPDDAPLFLDFKGTMPRFGEWVVREIEEAQEGRQIIVCGREWYQLDPIESLENVHVFYSAGSIEELAQVWDKLARQAHPAISINYVLATEETMARLTELGATVVAWTVNDPAVAARLFRLGVDGFTSDNPILLEQIVRLREHAFDDYDTSGED